MGGRLAPIKKTSNLPALQASHISTSLELAYVYLDTDERAKFAEGQFEQLVCQTQNLTQSFTSAKDRVRLDFNHTIIELLWAVRKQSSADANDHFNFSGITEPVTGANRDPVESATLRLNNNVRFSDEGRYFRLVQPYQHHTNVPESFVYSYSFALNPEDVQPSGTVNFSRIDNATLEVNLDDNLFKDNSTVTTGPPGNAREDSVDLIIYARNWNVLRFKNGLAGLAFSS